MSQHRAKLKVKSASVPASVPDRLDDKALLEQVSHVLNLIRPAVQLDGGDVELVEITPEHIVRVRMHGNCVGCPSSAMTLQMGIERNLRDRIPQITGVEQVK